MKNKTFLFIVILIISFAFTSCKKLNSCAHCTENNTGYTPADFCGPEISVDTYIEELENTAGQNWTCEKIQQ